MSQPNSSFGELASVTINNMSKTVADNVTQNNAVLTLIAKSGNVKPSAYEDVDGGLNINEAIEFAENVNTNSYSGYDILGTAAQDVITTASFPLKQYASVVMFNGLEEMENAGDEKIIDIVESRVDNAFHSIENRINNDLYSDGTGNSGKNITGLNAAVPLSPTNVYGGIPRSTQTFWANKKFQASVDGSGVITASSSPLLIQSYFDALYADLQRGKDRPTAIIAGQGVWSFYMNSLQNIQRIYDSETASLGFKSISFMGDIPVVLETTASGIATTDAFFLNTKYLKWRPHRERDFVRLKDRESVNQDATAVIITWGGNLTCNASFLQGRFSNT
jgi:hypothetical protein